ncbi:MAG: chromate transporter [Oscillospiraceae bacterium]|jgi:chromate transporter|nr:chromate transporter [Oscillospiraceae bacterium]
MREAALLFLVFARVGITTFGGGYAIMPVLDRELVKKRGWASHEELLDYYAVAQCTPGVIAVNTSTFIGYRRAGVTGGIAATLGLVFPPTVIICVIAAALSGFMYLPAVRHAFAGIRVCVCVLIAKTLAGMLKKSAPDLPAKAIFTAVFILSAFLSFPTAALVAAAGVAGLAISAARGGRVK